MKNECFSTGREGRVKQFNCLLPNWQQQANQAGYLANTYINFNNLTINAEWARIIIWSSSQSRFPNNCVWLYRNAVMWR
jgi:hypothetical protein